jgi:hypothetical protein
MLLNDNSKQVRCTDVSTGSMSLTVLTTAKVERLFEVYDSADDAIKSFRSRPEAAAG